MTANSWVCPGAWGRTLTLEGYRATDQGGGDDRRTGGSGRESNSGLSQQPGGSVTWRVTPYTKKVVESIPVGGHTRGS